MLNVFMSFADEDAPIVGRLQRAAVAKGNISVYRYDRDKRPGTIIAAKVRTAIQKADVVVVLLTKHSARSSWIQHEIGAAHALNKRLVPLLVPAARVPPLLEGVEALALDPEDPAGSIARAAHYLNDLGAEKERQELAALIGIALLVLVFE